MRRLALIVACAAAGCAGLGSSAPDLPDTGSTLVRTWVDPGHTGVLVPGPGEPLVPRTELAPAARLLRPLATFAQITDAHVTDEESPARVEMLDRLGPPFTSAFRPQEALSPFVLAAIVRSVNRVHPQAVFETGDLIDNAQLNEMDQATAILRGGRVDPNSGQPGYDGVQDQSNPDPLIYRPAVDAPRYPRLLAQAERPFTSPGLRAPWYPLPGNHDLEVQGNVPATPATERVAVGDRKLLTVDRSTIEAARGKTLDRHLIDQLLAQGLPGRSEFVPADPRRRELSPAQAVAALRSASGHGGSGALMDDTVDLGPSARAIMLDTTRRRAGASGVLRASQVTWLRVQLAAAGSRWLLVFSSTPLTETAGAPARWRCSPATTTWWRRSPATCTETASRRCTPRPAATGRSPPRRWPTTRSRPARSGSGRRRPAWRCRRGCWTAIRPGGWRTSRGGWPGSTTRAAAPTTWPAPRPTATRRSTGERHESRSSRVIGSASARRATQADATTAISTRPASASSTSAVPARSDTVA